MSCNGLNRRRISDGQQVIRCLDAALCSLRATVCFGDGQQVIRCLDAMLCSLCARLLMNESVPVGRSRCLNARENTVLGSLWCGDKHTTLGNEWKCVHVRVRTVVNVIYAM